MSCFICVMSLGLSAHVSGQRDVTVGGAEFTAAVDVIAKGVSVDGQLFVPRTTTPFRSAIVLVQAGLGVRVFDDPEWRDLAGQIGSVLVLARFTDTRPTERGTAPADQVVRNAALGGAEGLLLLMQRLATTSGRPELADVPLVFWGHSAGASFGTSFAELHPQRTVAFIRYHTQRAGLSSDVNVLKGIPALLIAGGKDNQNRLNDTREMWRNGRVVGAPWTFVIEPEATHFDEIDIRHSNALTLPWIAAVVRLRLSDGPSLKSVIASGGWLGNQQTLLASTYSSFTGPVSEASWLPDGAASRGWERVARTPPPGEIPSLLTPTHPDARNPMLGAWRGLVSMGTFQFGAEVLLERLNLGDAAGQVVYLDGTTPACSSSVVLIRRADSDHYVLAETLTAGRACATPGRLDLRLLPDGRLQADWRLRRSPDEDSTTVGSATLERKIE
jgi:hypothetical protein